jgi:septal ring factor EnvC (AmiA/AmiB activator)
MPLDHDMTRRPLIIALLLLMAGAIAAPLHAGNLDKKRDELDRIKQEKLEKELQIKHARQKERSILSSLEKIDRQIQAGNDELTATQRRIDEAEAALQEIEEHTRKIKEDLPSLRVAYAKRLRALYKMSRSGGYTFAILSAGSYPSAYRRMRYLGAIAERDQRLIEEYSLALEHLALREKEISDLQDELLAGRKDLKKKRTSLQSRRRQKAQILASLKQEKSVYEATLKELEESEANLWAMVRLAEQDKRSWGAASGRSGQRLLPWPVQGRVLTSFGKQRHPTFGTVVFRRGIEIAAREGDEVRAVEEGQVAFADWYKGYGRLVIIDHGSGMYTLYGHLSRLDVRGGDAVGQGQVIGLAGETGSLQGTKLYFELRRNGEAEDPLSWLAKR